jgi:hypothetical protein
MKSLYSGLFLALCLDSTGARADVIYDSNQPPPGGAYYFYGATNYQEEGDVIALAGTARTLQSVTLHDFTYNPGTYEISATIYAVPTTINDNDVLSNPLWSETVQESFDSGFIGEISDVNFNAPNIQLPDQIVLDFSFTAVAGSAAIFCQGDYAGNRSYNPPAVGQIASDANYEGVGTLPASWYNNPPGTLFLYPSATAVATPEPAAILPLSLGVLALLCFRRGRQG